MWNAKRERALALAALGGLWLGACKQASAPIQPSIFTNPNELALVCFSTDSGKADPTLPLDCCDGVLGDDAQAAEKVLRCGDWSVSDNKGSVAAASHALVTQVQRGEVAAVDLEARKVLDSDKRVPGYTFVDVGGLPTAIAVRSGLGQRPPHWTYVAGRERNSLRAVATCRFKVGERCGPELAVASEETERALAGEPFDMQLAADEAGLWLTLPDEGLLAYVPLPEAANEDAPFAGDPIYYPLPGGFDTKPSLPEPETEPYRFACRYDESRLDDDAGGMDEDDADGGVEAPKVGPDMSDPAPWEADKLVMPLSVPAESTRVPRPTLLRMVDLNPRGESDPTRKLLFVADEGQMAVHAYAQDAAGDLALVASLPVGAPLRDFAVTPEVPALTPSYAGLMSDSYYEEAGATTRYLYAIDQRDGSLMAFSLAFDGGVPTLEPLLAPTPARDVRRHSSNRADRFSLGRDLDMQARALDVVDTRRRRRVDGSFDDAHCHVEDRDEDLDMLEKDAETQSKSFKREGTPESWRDSLLASDELSVLTNAGPSSLRGVFLMVATTRGQLSVLDVHDLDLECRAKLQCKDEPEAETGVVLARHSPRLGGSAVPTVSSSPVDEVTIEGSCPDGYELQPDRDDKNRVCVSKDAWLAQSFTFLVNYEAPITGQIADGVLEDAGDGKLLLKAPGGLDLCARGANAEDRLLVGILSPPDSAKVSEACEVTSFSSVPRLRVLSARRDELLLEPLTDEVDAETLLGCYRHLVTFDLRLDDQYLVGSELVGYQHRNMSAADGTCIRDESLDPRFTSRASLEEPFVNQFLSFTLSAKGITVDAGAPSPDAGGVDEGVDEDAGEPADEDAGVPDDPERALRREVNPSITISTPASITPVSSTVAGASPGRSDVLPHRVRYFPDNNYLFVVDQASQGLRRFILHPQFAADAKSVFR
jgi:hypothetical protein